MEGQLCHCLGEVEHLMGLGAGKEGKKGGMGRKSNEYWDREGERVFSFLSWSSMRHLRDPLGIFPDKEVSVLETGQMRVTKKGDLNSWLPLSSETTSTV